MTLAQQLVNRERTKTQLIDEGFNRHTSIVGGDGLPSWFIDDEQKHFRNNIPVTKEAVAAIRDKLRELNARPIKKIAEAKARTFSFSNKLFSTVSTNFLRTDLYN